MDYIISFFKEICDFMERFIKVYVRCLDFLAIFWVAYAIVFGANVGLNESDKLIVNGLVYVYFAVRANTLMRNEKHQE